MTFGFLAPFAIATVVVVGLPIVAHLTRQVPTDRVPYGAMLLVERLVKRLRRRRSVKDRLLLLLRALALIFAVLAAMAPRLSWQGDVPDFGGSGRIVLVVDTSMSMALYDQGATLLDRAVAEAARRVHDAPDGVRFGIVAFDQDARRLTEALDEDKDRVLAILDTLEPSIHAGDLRAALLDARRLLDGEPGEIFLFSDEAGPVMVPAATEELARIVETGSAVLPVPILADPPRNLAVTRASYGDGIEGGQVTFRVFNYGDGALEVACEVRLPDGAAIPVFVEVPPEAEAEARVTVPREAQGGVGRVRCEDPDLPLDDARWFHLPQVGASRVLVVDGDPGDTPIRSEVYFLERALAPWGGLKSGVTPDVVSPKGLDRLDPSVHKVAFLANVSDPRGVGPLLRDFVRRGGALVVTMGDNVTAERYNAALGAALPAVLRKPVSLADRMEEPVRLAMPTLEHPILDPFERQGRASLARVGAWRAMALEPYQEGGDVTTLLHFEGGLPALLERKVGSGRVLMWTSSVDLGWSNLPLQAAFMPLTQRMVSYLGGQTRGALATEDVVVGERVAIELPEGVSDAVVKGPSGEVRHRLEGSRVVFSPTEPGEHVVSLQDGPALAHVAVNTDPMESDVRRVHSVGAVEADLVPELFTRHQELSGPALWASFAFLVLSSLVAVIGGGP